MLQIKLRYSTMRGVNIMKPFIKLLKTPRCYYFFDVNRNTFVNVSKECWHYLNGDGSLDNCIEEVNTLKNNGFLSDNHIQELKHTETDNVEHLIKNCLSELILQVTQACNLCCVYCPYASSTDSSRHRKHTSKQMDFETAKAAIDFLYDHSTLSDSVSFAFYGGEPLIAFPLIKQCVSYIQDIFDGKEISFSMTTNATLLTDEIKEFLIDNGFSITFSMDGPKEIHDKNRKRIDGTGTYDRVISELNDFVSAYPQDELVKIMVNMVINPEDDLDVINNWANNCLNTQIYLGSNVVENDDLENKFDNYDPYNEKFEYLMAIHLLDHLQIVKGLEVSRLTLPTFNRIKELYRDLKTTNASLPTVGAPSGPCVSGCRKLFVNVSGDFYPCEKVNEMSEAMKIGSLETGINVEKVKAHINIAQLTPEKCINCWAQANCDLCQKYVADGDELSAQKKVKLCDDVISSFHYYLRCCALLKESCVAYKSEEGN